MKCDYTFIDEIRYDYQSKIKAGQIRSTEKIPFVCEKHGEYWQKLNKHQLGQRCPKCAAEKRSLSYRKMEYDLADVRNDYQDKLRNGEISAHTKIPFICTTHGEYWQTIANHYNKHTGCPRYGDASCSEKRRKYSPILNTKDYGEFTCEKHGVYLQSFDKHYNAHHGCPLCAQSGKVSGPEKALREFVESLGFPLEYNKRDVIAPLELDIYIPDKKVAIEYNGNYWHCELNKTPTYHLNKYKKCAEKNIRLIQVWEYEWYDERKRPIIESIIKSALGVYDEKLNARECELVILPSKEVQSFLDMNNLGGRS